MLVYRVENERGFGPYVGGSYHILEAMRDDHNTVYDDPADDPHPGPRDDGIDWMGASEYSGFATHSKAQEWFAGYGVTLDEAGFDLTIWEAQDVRRGGKQVAFRKDTATLVASYPVLEYIK